MNLVAANKTTFRGWLEQPASELVDHGESCCTGARAWLQAMAVSHAFRRSDGTAIAAPTFLSRRYKWGPTAWPIALCEAVRAPAIDCGVFSAFARTILSAQGVECYSGQVMQLFNPETTAHWRQLWAGQPGSFNWIDDQLVYHEVVIVVAGDVAEVFDPTHGQWLSPSDTAGYGAVVAVRSECPKSLPWGRHTLSMDQWSLTVPALSWGG
jgi:hypothetical protein